VVRALSGYLNPVPPSNNRQALFHVCGYFCSPSPTSSLLASLHFLHLFFFAFLHLTFSIYGTREAAGDIDDSQFFFIYRNQESRTAVTVRWTPDCVGRVHQVITSLRASIDSCSVLLSAAQFCPEKTVRGKYGEGLRDKLLN
jgi:hypothetical protein